MPIQRPTPAFHLAPALAGERSLSPTLYINQRVKERWAAGETIYHLGFGESRFPVHPKIRAALIAHADARSYLPTLGIPELRRAVADFYTKYMGVDATPERVIVAPGSKPLLYAFQMALAGDTILPTPSWVSYAPQAQLLNRPVWQIPASPGDEHRLTVEALQQTIAQSAETQHILILNSPSNPTGQMLAPDLLAGIAEVCRATNTLVLSDEIYALTSHDHTPHVSISQFYPEGTVVLGGLSKHLSLGGWRLGVAIAPTGAAGQQLLQAVVKIGGELWSCVAAPVQYAALTAYGDDPEILGYIAESSRLHMARTQHLWRGLCELDIPCARPEGGFYLYPNFDGWRQALAAKSIHTSDDLARHLLDVWHIASLPGTAFGAPAKELSLRLSSSYVDMEDDAQAAALLALHRSGVDAEALVRDHHPALAGALTNFRAFLASLHE
ncbi:MAG: aminotransferase class I/II-fold pyridoxal phosphate-dependent enzyme [Caldilineaceae bacterium]|nr:aminotransferase class I/II-fold pyridoxal phosphate-dependent enzyme [Caldilineaceae bacterium]